MSVIPIRGTGFFSCCSIRLHDIIIFINKHRRLPNKVDSKNQFKWYKKKEDLEKDISFTYFENYNNLPNLQIKKKIDYRQNYQFKNYSLLKYGSILPVLRKYFSPSKNILNIMKNIENKYNLIFDNICVLFYRGNDKITETKLCNYNEYLKYAYLIKEKSPNIKFLIQSDETEFINFMTEKFPQNSFYFKDEIRHIKKSNTTVDIVMKDKNFEFSQYYLGITILMSKCKYIICGSGNCSIWIVLYRGNSKNVFQNLNGKWIINIK